jgi:hypothetical protein
MRQVLFLLALSFGPCSWMMACAQNEFLSGRLGELYAQMPVECRITLAQRSSGRCLCDIHGQKLPVKAVFNPQGQVTHLGVDIFSFDANLFYPNSLLSFLERTFLEYVIWNDLEHMVRKNLEDGLSLLIEGKAFGMGTRDAVSDFLPMLLCKSLALDLVNDSLLYTATLTCPGSGSIQLLFSANYQLVSGMDKKEYADHLFSAVSSYRHSGSEVIVPGRVLPYKDDVLVSPGKFFFKDITSDTYFRMTDGGIYELLSDQRYPLESFSNLLLTGGTGERNITLDIEQKMYGRDKRRYNVKVNDFVKYFAQGHELYFGSERGDESTLSGTMIMYNRQMNFINLLYVEADRNTLFASARDQVVTGKLYTNIPTDNVANLFGEKNNEK